MTKSYNKPHLTFEQQMDQLADRKLGIYNQRECIEVLEKVGYYRLSAYWYPFRVLKPETHRTTSRNYRYDNFSPGHSFDEAVSLYSFDSKLRDLTFEALETVEVSLRTNIAYYAGKNDPYLHLRRSKLNKAVCNYVPKGKDKDSYTMWLNSYHRQLGRSKNEDFVGHYIEKYGRQIPIWIAIEFLDFGSISMLYSYLPKDIQSQIAPRLGTLQGKSLAGWIKNFNYVRNIIAHHSRLWNRVLITRLQPPNKAVVDACAHHLSEAPQDRFKRLYPTLAMLAYVLSFIDPSSSWRLRVNSLVSEFPEIEGLSLSKDMGFPLEWERIDIWRPDLQVINGSALLVKPSSRET